MLRGLTQFVGLCCLLSSGTSTSAAEITHESLENGGLVSIEGNITSGDLERFREISVRYSNAIVVLDSDGGALLPAIEIGKIIKIAGFVTLVPDDAVCASSCALIWLAGETRFLSPNGHVGFHASYRDNNGRLEESGVANALIGNYLTRLNLPERAIVFATTAPPDEITWLTGANKSTAGIDFENFALGGETESAKGAQVTSAPPTLVAPRQQTSALPPTLPASLSRTGSEWVKFASNAYYDANSIHLVENIRGQSAGRRFWVVIDYSSNPKSRYTYAMVQYFAYCPNETLSVYHWTDYRRSGESKVRDASPRSVPAAPGSAERVLVSQVCR